MLTLIFRPLHFTFTRFFNYFPVVTLNLSNHLPSLFKGEELSSFFGPLAYYTVFERSILFALLSICVGSKVFICNFPLLVFFFRGERNLRGLGPPSVNSKPPLSSFIFIIVFDVYMDVDIHVPHILLLFLTGDPRLVCFFFFSSFNPINS